MIAPATRTTLDVVKTCLWPEVRFGGTDYQIESVDGIDCADCWWIEIEWLSLTLHVQGGRFKPGKGA